MRLITALLHTHNDALRLGRCLETLYPCDEIVILDHASTDATLKIARDYGAKVVAADSLSSYERIARHDWMLCLDSRESLTESLAASLFDWKTQPSSGAETSRAFSVFCREETPRGWTENSQPQTRLVPANWDRWEKHLPVNEPSAVALEGELLRFVFP